MTQLGISGAPVPAAREYARLFNDVGILRAFPPLVICAVRLNETAEGFPPDGLQDGADPATGLMPNGSNAGHGIMQLTSSWPADWADPGASIDYATTKFLIPARDYWAPTLQGDDLVRAIAASYNAGIGGAQLGHDRGDVDLCTTDRYGARALAHYLQLAAAA